MGRRRRDAPIRPGDHRSCRPSSSEDRARCSTAPRSFGGDDKFLPMSAFRGSASPTQSWNHFRFAVNDGVATLTFDRPQKLNALTFQVYADLRDLLTELPQRDDVRVLVITGTGRGFSSGGDVTEIIGELQKMDPRDLLAFARMTGTVTQDRKSTRLNSSHLGISYAVFCLKKKKKTYKKQSLFYLNTMTIHPVHISTSRPTHRNHQQLPNHLLYYPHQLRHNSLHTSRSLYS